MAGEVIEPVGYYTSALRALVWATRATLNSDEAKKVHGFSELRVDADAPLDIQVYPYVHVQYQDGGFRPAELQKHDWIGAPAAAADIAAYRYSGTASINVYSNSILERDRIADAVIGLVGIDRRFQTMLRSNAWIGMTPNMAELRSTTANQSWGTPWDDNLITAFRTLSFPVTGEFSYRVGESVVFLGGISVDERVIGG